MDDDSEDDKQQQQDFLDWVEGCLIKEFEKEFPGCETKVDALTRQPSGTVLAAGQAVGDSKAYVPDLEFQFLWKNLFRTKEEVVIHKEPKLHTEVMRAKWALRRLRMPPSIFGKRTNKVFYNRLSPNHISKQITEYERKNEEHRRTHYKNGANEFGVFLMEQAMAETAVIKAEYKRLELLHSKVKSGLTNYFEQNMETVYNVFPKWEEVTSPSFFYALRVAVGSCVMLQADAERATWEIIKAVRCDIEPREKSTKGQMSGVREGETKQAMKTDEDRRMIVATFIPTEGIKLDWYHKKITFGQDLMAPLRSNQMYNLVRSILEKYEPLNKSDVDLEKATLYVFAAVTAESENVRAINSGVFRSEMLDKRGKLYHNSGLSSSEEDQDKKPASSLPAKRKQSCPS
jgi:hypothetical protein